MKRLFHGTTLKNWESIKQNGFGFEADKNAAWWCSNDSETYFYDQDKSDYDDLEGSYNDCIYQAFSSAQLSAAVNGYNSTELVVIELLVDSELCEDDWSCENMHDIATVVDNDDLELSMVQKVHTNNESYLPCLRLAYVIGILNRPNTEMRTDKFLEIELKMAEAFQNSEIFIEDLFVDDWTTDCVKFQEVN